MADPAGIRLLSLDLDGTCLERDGVHLWLADEVVEVLNALGERGVRWCTNSGRTPDNQLGMVQTCRGLRNMPVAILSCERNIHWLNPHYRPHEPHNRRNDERHRDLLATVRAALAPHLNRLRSVYPINYEADADLLLGFNMADADSARRLLAELRELLRGLPGVQWLRNGTWVVAADAAAGKGVVLSEAARHLGVAREEILAVGDNANDLDMLDGRAAGFAGCPADADPLVLDLVRRSGGWVAETGGARGTAELLCRCR